MSDYKQLLQELWDQYLIFHNNVTDEVGIDSPACADTLDMIKLRRELFDAGIANIPGYRYY